MAGFPLGAIATGLGQFAQQYQKQQEQQRAAELQRLRVQQFMQEQQDRQRQQEASGLAFGAIRGGTGDGGDTGLTGSLPGATRVPDAGQPIELAPAVTGGGTAAGSGSARLAALLGQVAPKVLPAGYTANITSQDRPGARVAGTGGVSQHSLGNAIDAQITGPSGPIPNKGEDTTGLYKKLALGMRENAGADAPKLAWGGNFTTGGPNAPRDLMHFDLGGDRGRFGTLKQLAQQTAQQTAQSINPTLYGRVSLPALAQQIEKANPGADPVVKMMALEHVQKLLAPDQRMQWEMFKQQHDDKFKMMLQDRQDARQERGIVAGEQRQEQRDIAAERRLDRRLSGGGASHNVEVTDADGKVIFSGAATKGEGGWKADKDQSPINIPADANIKILGTGGQGRQAAAQIQSMIGASSELVGEARNLMELPSTAVAGIFQGVQSVPAGKLGEAMARTLANKLTPEESTDLATSFQGVARSLATIEAQGRATGLVGLTGMSQGLMPQTGDTTGNVLRKMATLRQIMERNIDAIEASPNASTEQKKLLKALRGEMAQVVPFTVSEVNKLQHGDAETVAQAAKKFGLAGGDGGAAPAAGGGEVIQNGWRYDAKTHQPIGPVQ